MNIVKSINSRLNGIKQDFKSRYWEYGNYFKDQVVWEQSILFESFGGLNFQGNPYYIFKEIFLNSSQLVLSGLIDAFGRLKFRFGDSHAEMQGLGQF